MRSTRLLILIAVAALSVAHAATPPGIVNYQGVLRDSGNVPLDGSYDMQFHFWSAETGGEQIVLDRHLAANGQAVDVTQGLFNVQLGSGQLLDGTGAGTYTDLAQVFRDYDSVWLGVQIGSETLTPRVRVASAGFAMNSTHLGGRAATEFVDGSTSTQSKQGNLIIGDQATPLGDYGIQSYGSDGGAYFSDVNDTGYAYLGTANRGIWGYGRDGGAYFVDTDDSGIAQLGYGDYGVWGSGNVAGGFFQDADHDGFARVGVGNAGISANGSGFGGYFSDTDQSGYAYVARGNQGVEGYGTTGGGYFQDSDDGGYVWAGYGNIGASGAGNLYGARFSDLDDSGVAHIGNGDIGITSQGDFAGGYFEDLNESGRAYIGNADVGVSARGNYAGGQFFDDNSSGWSSVGFSTYKVQGNGTVSFTQNHPEDPSRVIVYHAPESSEVSVYTRGSARLSDGRAVVELDPTFAWVANPDVGLTAHLTPRGGPAGLFVESVSTSELVVIGPAGSDAELDYMVWGLRIGFEELATVQPKAQESFIPSMSEHRELYAKDSSLRSYTALSRFKQMRSRIQGLEKDSIDLSRANALIARIGEYDPDLHGSIDELELGVVSSKANVPPRTESAHSAPAPKMASGEDVVAEVTALEPGPVVHTEAATRTGTPSQPDDRLHEQLPAGVTWVTVTESVAPGDVLTLDPEQPGELRRATFMADAGVVGVAARIEEIGEDGERQAPIYVTGIVQINADAGFGAIRPGDLLIASPTTGHAMRATDLVPGTVLGKALDGLDNGMGSIRVLLTPR